jgi:hypothetical protein
MAAVATIDQRGSRGALDLVTRWVDELNSEYAPRLELPFARTIGDELQGLVADPDVLVDLVVRGARHRHWWLGIGLGDLERPLPDTTAQARGAAFYNAREAVQLAKRSEYGFAVQGRGEPSGPIDDALTLLSFIVARRGAENSKGWEAIDLVGQGFTQAQIGERLGVTQQAIAQRLHKAGWNEEQRGRRLSARLLEGVMKEDDGGE